MDGDGISDFLVTAPYATTSVGALFGKVYLILGNTLDSTTTRYLSDADYSFLAENAYDYAGYSAAGIGDVDGNGLDDILIGAYGYNSEAGMVHIQYSKAQ